MITDTDTEAAKKILEFTGNCECQICIHHIAAIIAKQRGEYDKGRASLVVCNGVNNSRCDQDCYHATKHDERNSCRSTPRYCTVLHQTVLCIRA